MFSSVSFDYGLSSCRIQGNKSEHKVHVAGARSEHVFTIRLFPLTLPYRDLQDRDIQLWKCDNVLLGTVTDSQGNRRFFSGRKIKNPCRSGNDSIDLVRRLDNGIPQRWQLAYEPAQGEIYIFPYLIAAGKDYTDPNFCRQQIDKCMGALDKRHLKAAWLETKRNQTVAWKQSANRRYNHWKEVRDHQQGLKKVVHGIRGALGDQGLSSKQRGELVQQLRRASSKLDVTERYVASRNLRTGEDPSGGPPDLRGGGGSGKKPPGGGGPGGKGHKENLQQNKLTDSHNSRHPKKPIPAKGGSGGSIGGVGNDVGIIEGLFDSVDGLKEDHHHFFFPTVDGEMPFSNEELRQLVRELTKGIYLKDAVPFFSLHFNSDTNMYPVIHPIYQNTMVGHVISMLDYYMKGFLNGGFFDAKFLENWDGSQDKEYLRKNCIQLHEYCQKHLGGLGAYSSVRELVQAFDAKREREGDNFVTKLFKGVGLKGLASRFKGFGGSQEPKIFSDYSGFRSSFRIIAKQNSIRKTGNVFALDADFDVFYTIEPDPSYKEELARYIHQHGQPPVGYLKLVYAYQQMQYQIKELMPQLPHFKKLFAQLKVINFLCYYLKTLKQAQKIPLLQKHKLSKSYKCAPLFPHLPVRSVQVKEYEIDIGALTKGLSGSAKARLRRCLNNKNSSQLKVAVEDVCNALYTIVQKKEPESIGDKKAFIEGYRKVVEKWITDAADTIRIAKTQTVTESEIEQLRRGQGPEGVGYRMAVQGAQKLPQLQAALRSGREDRRKAQEALKNMKEVRRKYDGGGYRLNGSYSDLVSAIRELEEGLPKQKQQMEDLKSQIELLKKFEDPIAYFSGQGINLPVPVRVIKFYSEQSEEEKEKNRQVVGGCGVDLKNLAAQHIPNSEALLNAVAPALLNAPSETLAAVPNGVAFRLDMVDFNASRPADYDYLISMFEDFEDSEVREAAAAAIAVNDQEGFKALLPTLKDSASMIDRGGVSLMHYAAAASSPYFLSALISKGFDVNRPDANGYTPMHYAAQHGRSKAIHLIHLKSKTAINALCLNSSTPLHVAVQNNHLDAVCTLLKLEANSFTKTHYGMTPLYCAVHHGHEEIALALLQSSPNSANISLEDGRCPLHVAIETKQHRVVVALVKVADVTAKRKDTYRPIHLAAQSGNVEAVEMLIQAKADVNVPLKSGKTALHLAAEHGHVEVVQKLLAFGASPAMVGWDKMSPLMVAIKSGNTDCARVLIAHCANHEGYNEVLTGADIENETPLLAALSRCQLSVLEALFKNEVPIVNGEKFLTLACRAGIDGLYLKSLIRKWLIDISSEKLLFLAAEQGHNQLVSLHQIEHGLGKALSKVDDAGWGLMHFAAQYDHVDVIRAWIASSPKDLLMRTKQGLSVAAIAASHGSCRVLQILLKEMKKNECSLDKQWKDQHLLAIAVDRGQQKAVETIVQETLDPNVKLNKEGLRVAHIAVRNDDVELLAFLRSRGAKLDLPDEEGLTAVHHAFMLGSERVIDYLLDEKNEVKLSKDLVLWTAHSIEKKYLARLFEKDIDVDLKDPKTGETALLKAVRENRADVVATLIHHGASTAICSKKGLTPLTLAASYGHLECLRQLLPLCKDREEALKLAASRGYEAICAYLGASGVTVKIDSKWSHNIKLILKGQAEALIQKKRLIIKALQNGNPSLFFALIKGLPLDRALEFEIRGQKEIVPINQLIYLVVGKSKLRETLLKQLKSGDPRAKNGDRLIHLRASKGDVTGFEKKDLLGANREGVTPLHRYAECLGQSELSQMLKAKIDNIDVVDKQGDTPLMYAIRASNIEAVHELLAAGADIGTTNLKRETPLRLAVEQADGKMVDLLLSFGADINQRCGKRNEIVLNIAVGGQLFNMIELLVSHGADVNLPVSDGVRPIHLAATGDIKALRLLHAAGADLKACDDKSQNAAHYAAAADDLQILDYLDKHGVSVRQGSKLTKPLLDKKREIPNGLTPLHIASARGHVDIIESLISKGANVEAKTAGERGVLAYAATSGNKQAIRFFNDYRISQNSQQRSDAIVSLVQNDDVKELERFANIETLTRCSLDKEQNTPLHYAALFGSLKCVTLLLDNGAEPGLRNTSGQSPVDLAVERGQLGVVSLFANLGNKKLFREKHLHKAARAGRTELVGLLLEVGLPIDSLDEYGYSPLHLASKNGHYRLVELLLACGADTEKKTLADKKLDELIPKHAVQISALVLEARKAASTKQPLIHRALGMGSTKHLSLLCRIGDVNEKNQQEDTPLHVAIEKNNLSAVRVLLDRGASLTIANGKKETPLHLAVIRDRNLDVVKLLLGSSLDVNVVNASGMPLLYEVTEIDDKKWGHQVFEPLYRAIKKESHSSLPKEAGDAIVNENMQALFAAIQSGCPIENDHFSFVIHAVQQRKSKILNAILEWFVPNLLELNQSKHSPLHVAAAIGNESAAVSLLSKGASVAFVDAVYKRTPLAIAALEGKGGVVGLLLGNKADPKEQEGRLLEEVYKKSKQNEHYRRIFDLLYKFFPKPSSQSLSSSMRQAFNQRDLRSLFKELSVGHGLESKVFSLLHEALAVDWDEVVKLMVERFRVNLEWSNNLGRRALHMAAIRGNSQILKFLHSKGAKLEAQTTQKETPLFLAAKTKQTRAFKELLNLGANPLVDNGHRTLFHELLIGGNSTHEMMRLVKSRLENRYHHPDLNRHTTEAYFFALNKGCSVKGVVEAAVKASSVAFLKLIIPEFKDTLDLDALRKIASENNSTQAEGYIKSLQPGRCVIL